MKHTLHAMLLLLATLPVACKKDLRANELTREETGKISSVKNLQVRDSVQAIINKYVSAGIPGIQVT